jgi:rRNA small subunit pseudouridine methyltransferase Nep1
LLALLDSPLAKSGRLQIYIHTQRDILIEVNPLIRIPRTYKRFAGLMVQLLQKLSVKAATTNHGKLLKVIKNPITKHLPAGARRILMSPSAKKFVNINEFAQAETPIDGPTVFVIGGMAKGVCKVDYADEEICISNFSLSAASVCSKLCYAYEEYWSII